VSQVARVQNEIGPQRERIDACDGLHERARHVGVHAFLAESNMRIADLNETEIGFWKIYSIFNSSGCFVNNLAHSVRLEYTATHQTKKTGTSPGHAFKKTRPVNTIIIPVK